MTDSMILHCETDSVRIDQYLSSALNDLSRSYIQKLIGDGQIKVNGEISTSKKRLVLKDDMIEVNIPDPELLKIVAEDIPLDILYEDDDLIIVNKPQGMVVHPAPGNYSGTLVNALMYTAERLSSINGVIRPGIVHRIDKDTSGLLMVAKNDAQATPVRGVLQGFGCDIRTVLGPIDKSAVDGFSEANGVLLVVMESVETSEAFLREIANLRSVAPPARLSIIAVANRIYYTYLALNNLPMPSGTFARFFFWRDERATLPYDIWVVAILIWVWFVPPDWLSDPVSSGLGLLGYLM